MVAKARAGRSALNSKTSIENLTSSIINVCLIVSQTSFNNRSASGLTGAFLKKKQKY